MAPGLRIGLPVAAALAAASLLLPYQPLYDPWGWLVWGRELTRLDLATADGMSWKPLPAFVDAPLALLGEAAPKGWLLVARGGWLAAPLLAGWLAARLAGEAAGRWRLAAAAIAAGSVALTGDSFTPPARQFGGGLSEPLLVALALGAVAAALERRPVLALWLGCGAGLLRPEAWPFLAAWAIWQWGREPRLRPHALAVAVLLPLAWFLPDLLGAGDPLAGSRTARDGPVEPLDAFAVLGRALAAPLAAAWVGVALFAVLRERGGGEDGVLLVLLAGAGAWIALVAAMAAAGFAGLPRFLAPASAALAIVGGVGVARAAARGLPRRAGRPLLAAAAAIALLAGLAGFGLRAAAVPGDLRNLAHHSRVVDGLPGIAARVPTDTLFSCGGRVRLANLVAPPTALAWQLDVPIGSVRVNPHPEYGVALSTRPILGGRLIARHGRWRVTELSC